MRLSYHVFSAPAPLGLLFLAGAERGLRHLEYLERRSIKRVIAGHSVAIPGAEWQASLLALKDVADQLSAYLNGQLRGFDLALDLAGTPFQLAVWRAVAAIPYGETRSHSDLAKTIGQPRAGRAVAAACHENPLAIVVPTHRVTGTDAPAGPAALAPRARWLLEHETRFARATVRAGEITEFIPGAGQAEPVLAATAAAAPSSSSRASAGRATSRGTPVRKPLPAARRRKATAVASAGRAPKPGSRRRT